MQLGSYLVCKIAEEDKEQKLIGYRFPALWGVGRESEAESVRFHGRRVTGSGPEVKHGLFRVAGTRLQPPSVS